MLYSSFREIDVIIYRSLTLPSLTLADLARMASTDPLNDTLDSSDSSDANPLGLRPDPVQFVKFLQAIGRTEVSSDVFVKILEAYQERRRGVVSGIGIGIGVSVGENTEDDDPMRCV